MEPSVPPEAPPASWLEAGAPPLEIDIGCHKGLFLTGMAALYPGHNFLGIERQHERVVRTRRKIEALQLANAAVLRAEGLESVKGLPGGSASCIHVLFPDPWPKRRHHIRRLVQTEFLAAAWRVLRTPGRLRLVTDDADYARAMREAARGFPAFREVPAEEREYPLTEFQKKFLADGRPVHALFLEKQVS